MCSALNLIKDCIFTAADHLKPGSAELLERLEDNPNYVLELTPLVRPHFVEMMSLTTHHSPARVSPCSEVKSRRPVPPLWQ